MFFFYNDCLNLLRSRQIVEIVSSQYIAIIIGAFDQCSIIDCDAVI